MQDETILELNNIEKSFGDVRVLKGISLAVKSGEFITLLGSSGCGKTTLLRIISGLETPDAGQVLLEGLDVTNAEPNRRNVNTVFQSYALFPHMTVAHNIGYSLRLKHTDKKQIDKTVAEALDMVQLTGFGKRMPHELSGGQRQRVAIARAIVNHPKVLLLDEPLGALDLQLRHQMQLELKRLQTRLGITFIYITHDQEEALNMSDRIAVMREGVFEQMGMPADVYDRPESAYVARFVGSANILSGVAKHVSADTVTIQTPYGIALVERRNAAVSEGQPVTLSVRREQISLQDGSGYDWGLSAVITEKSFAGGILQIVAALGDGTEIKASRYGIDSELKPGQSVTVRWEPANAVIVRKGDTP